MLLLVLLKIFHDPIPNPGKHGIMSYFMLEAPSSQSHCKVDSSRVLLCFSYTSIAGLMFLLYNYYRVGVHL